MEQLSLSLAKITEPRLVRVLPRERLFRLLDRRRQYPAVWVAGPPGSGKTTLVASYLEKRKLSCLWYQVDQGDSDIATFFYYMGLAGRKASPRKRKPLPLFTPEYALGISTFTRRYFEELFERLKKPAVVVLDNYQEALPESLLHEVIRDCLSVIPGQVNVLVLSRAEPPAALAPARASNLLDMIGWQELRLRAEETKELVCYLSRKECPDAVIGGLHQKAEGWIAGLLLLLKSRAIEEADPHVFRHFIPEEIFDYFASEILASAAPEVQQFLAATAIFPRMTARMAEKLTGESRADDILSRLNRNHCFTDRRLGHEITYQYHPLFREFLLAKSEHFYSNSQLLRLKDEAAKLLELDGQMEAAVSLFREAGDVKNMVRVILSQAHTLVLQGRYQTLEQWLNSLPEEVLGKEPWLIYWLGVCKMSASPLEGKAFFERALSVFEKRGDVAGIFLAICGVCDSITYSFQAFDLFDQWIAKLSALCKNVTSFPSLEIEARLTFSVLHALTLRQPQHADFKIWEKRALSFLQGNIDANAKLELLLPLICKRIFSGQLREAEVLINTYRGLTKSPAVTPLPLITFLDLKAFCCWLGGKFQDCNNAVTEALKLSAASGVYIMDGAVRGHGTAGALSSGDLASADTFLQSMEATLDREGPWMKGFFYTVATWRTLLKKDLAQATLYSELAVRWGNESGSPQAIAACYYGRALCLHACGEHHRAAEHLAQAFTLAHQTQALQEQYTCHLIQAEFALDLGDQATLVESLSEAMSLGSKQGYVNTYFWRPEVMTKLCCKALEADIEVEYVQDLIRKRNLIPDRPPVHLENWPWPLKIFTLGHFELMREGEPLRFSRKAQRVPLALLKALIAFGGRDVREEQVMDALWPEADGDVAYSSLTSTVHRLRKLLRQAEAVQFQQRRLSLDPCYCWVDVWVFEERFDKARAAWDARPKENQLAQAIQLAQEAVDIYRGSFLAEEIEQPWTISLRERLRSKFIRTVESLGHHWEAVGECKKAMQCYEQALEIEELAEECYRQLMVCHRELGQRTRAVEVYNRCRNALQKNLGVEPSPETEAIYKSLLS